MLTPPILEPHVLRLFTDLSRQLPAHLRPIAIHVATSVRSWEWKYYWAQGAELWLQEATKTKRLPSKGNWSNKHDEVYDTWNKSEWAGDLMRALARGKSLKEASSLCLKLLQKQLIQLAAKHFSLDVPHGNYRPQFELGDFPSSKMLIPINLGHGSNIEFCTWDLVNGKKHAEKISESLSLIKTYSPNSFFLFKICTKRIIPIKEKAIVSYSLQTLPGHSFINLYHRDRLDLLDDLLHENGHHFLNLHLIAKNFIREDPDQIYYSPWRDTLRPIRGIYHAHLTFFFALLLYHDLAQALFSNKLYWPWKLSKTEKSKIMRRYAEEWMMLEYTARDLQIAYQRGQITLAGWKHLKNIEKYRSSLHISMREINKNMNTKDKKTLSALSKKLSVQARLNRSQQ